MKDFDFINLYRDQYHVKVNEIRRIIAIACVGIFSTFSFLGFYNRRLSLTGLLQGIVAGAIYYYLQVKIIYQRFKRPKVTSITLNSTAYYTTKEYGQFLVDLGFYFAAGSAFLAATSGFSNPEHFWPIVPIPDDEGYPRLHRPFVTSLMFVFVLAVLRSFLFHLNQRNFVLERMSQVRLYTIASRAMQYSLFAVGASLILSIFLSSYGYDLLYNLWLCFQHVLYTRPFTLSGRFLGHLVLSGFVVNVFWYVMDGLASNALVKHLEPSVVAGAGARTLLSGLLENSVNDDYIRVFCASEFHYHAKQNAGFRRDIYGQPATSNQPSIQPTWPAVSLCFLGIFQSFRSDVRAMNSELPKPKPTQTQKVTERGAISISSFLDYVCQLMMNRFPMVGSHAPGERIRLPQLWAHLSQAFATLVSHSVIEDKLGTVQWDVQGILELFLGLYDELTCLYDNSPSAPYAVDLQYLLNALALSCHEIVDAYQGIPEFEHHLSQSILRVKGIAKR